jgi:hypothetical protein
MQEVNRNGIQIDICPACRGVWLDRGELEKLLSYTNQSSSKDDDDWGDERWDDRNYEHKKHAKKKRSLLDLLDFD